MSKNVKLNDVNYPGVSTVHIPTVDGGTAIFKDIDETVTPSGTKTITANGTYDVTSFAQAVVSVAASGGTTGATSIQTGVITVDEDLAYLKVTNLGFTPKAFAVLPSSSVIQNSTCGATIVNGSGLIWRTSTNGTTVGQGAMYNSFKEMDTLPDSSTGAYGGGVKVLESGFIVCATASNFPFRAGMEFSWVALG